MIEHTVITCLYIDISGRSRIFLGEGGGGVRVNRKTLVSLLQSALIAGFKENFKDRSIIV